MESKAYCPICNTDLNIKISVSVETGGHQSFTEIVHSAVQSYLFWELNGRPEHGKEQWYYNPWDSHVEYIPKNKSRGVFRFRIKVYDSPSGGRWIQGEVEAFAGAIAWDTLKLD